MTPVFVGIAGGSGSGKTWLAKALAGSLGLENTEILDSDAYYRDLSHLPEADRVRTNFDHPDALETDLLASHLRALGKGQAVEKPVYDFATHTRTGSTRTVMPRSYILVEGVMVLALVPVAVCLDLSIFLDIPADIRFIRRLERDRSHRGRTTPQIVRQYLSQVRPMHERFVAPCRERADLVFTSEPDISALAGTIRKLRHGGG